jgi:hypothetical protein
LEIVRKLEGQVGFQVLPRRWVVETTQPHYDSRASLYQLAA